MGASRTKSKFVELFITRLLSLVAYQLSRYRFNKKLGGKIAGDTDGGGMAERIKARHAQEAEARAAKLKKMAKRKVPNILTAKKVEKKLAGIMYNKVSHMAQVQNVCTL